jgi:hypothetical protein
MYLRAFLRWIAAGCRWLVVLAPAVCNGFPCLQYDTFVFLARWYEGTLVPSRAVVYGLMLNAGAPAAFWPVVAATAALTVWIIALVLRAHGFGGRPWLLLVVVTALTVLSTLPWLTSILLTDIFAGLGVLALYLLLLRPGGLSRNERFALTLLIAVCGNPQRHDGRCAGRSSPPRLPVVAKRSLRAHWQRRGRSPGTIFVCRDFVGRGFADAGRLCAVIRRMLQDGIVKNI